MPVREKCDSRTPAALTDGAHAMAQIIFNWSHALRR